MKVKKFIAATMPEAMQQIRSKLGNDAVILQSKEVKDGGFLGFFKKRQVEVVAALDPQPQPAKNKQRKGQSNERVEKSNKLSTIYEQTHPEQRENKQIIEEINHLKKILQAQQTEERTFPLDYQMFYKYLLEQEVDDELAIRLIEKTKQSLDTLPEVKVNDIYAKLKKLITKEFKHHTLSGIQPSTKIVQLIGPTGVGKTTTLAKLAAHSLMEQHKKVGFITIDTYRIAAIDQLKTYARILEVPFEVAYSLEDYKQAVQKLSHLDLIFVDTAGRNFREENYVTELTKYITALDNTEVFLVTSLTAKHANIQFAYEQFAHIPNKKLIFTKIDETRQYGSLLNIGSKEHVDLAYITNGQDVPHDIIQPEASMLSDYIMSEYYD